LNLVLAVYRETGNAPVGRVDTYRRFVNLLLRKGRPPDDVWRAMRPADANDDDKAATLYGDVVKDIPERPRRQMVRRCDDNSRRKVQNVRGDSCAVERGTPRSVAMDRSPVR
jgi:hypothetical protein